MTRRKNLISIALGSLFLIPLFGAFQMSHLIIDASTAHASSKFVIPDIPLNSSLDKQDQLIQLQKQNNKELAIIVCTDYRDGFLYGQPDSFDYHQWNKNDYDCIKNVLEDTK